MERFFSGSLLPVEEKEEGFVPSVDFKETEEGYELSAEVPGLKPEEIEVSLTGDILILKGEKKEEHEETKGDYHLVERRYGSFYRSFRLPSEVERGKLSATHKDGVLRVVLPKVK
ncbi:MAG: Hsp20/alpha crystallin family protein [Desulfarculus sp.]|nr:Hsp20/alpha crystallin family protein [Desulfarculus sp.]